MINHICAVVLRDLSKSQTIKTRVCEVVLRHGDALREILTCSKMTMLLTLMLFNNLVKCVSMLTFAYYLSTVSYSFAHIWSKSKVLVNFKF